MLVAIAAIVRYLPPQTIIIEQRPQKLYDTIRIIETTDKKHFRALNIELNRADTTELKRIYGVGSIFARRIVEYRNKLSGYYHKKQLREVKGITEEVFNKIIAHIWVDTLAIQKINLNFATRKRLEEHPYFSSSMINRLLQVVEMKGGYTTLGQLLDNNILLPQEAQKIAPYVTFSQQ